MTASNSSYPDTPRTMSFVEVWGDPIPPQTERAEKATPPVTMLNKSTATGDKTQPFNLAHSVKVFQKKIGSSIKKIAKNLRERIYL